MSRSREALTDTVAGVVILLLGVWVLWQAASLRQGPGYAAVGPRTFPVIVGLGLLGSGLGLLAATWRGWRRALPETGAEGPDAEVVEGAEDIGTDWRTLLAVAGLLAVYIALFKPLGFILVSIALLPVGAWALGSRSPLRDLLAGVGVSVATYLLFTRLLGLELPAGPLAGLL